MQTSPNQQLFEMALDTSLFLIDRQEACAELRHKAKTSKKSVAKLLKLTPEGNADWLAAVEYLDTATEEVDPLEEILDDPKAEIYKAVEEGQPIPIVAAKAHVERGLISILVRQMLEETELVYSDIVEVVKATYPHAKTTTRSVASVASDMRKAGLNVSIRRVAAK